MSMFLFFLLGTSWLLWRGDGAGGRDQSEKTTAAVLALAKEALIGRSATDNNRPGSLPCPDLNNDGIAELFSGSACPAYIGRLPWKTLDLPDPIDGNGDRLWYALAPRLRDHATLQPINPQQVPELTLDGVANIAAILFSPGAPLATQGNRPSNQLADYLEGSNSDGDFSFVSGQASTLFNDKLLAISRDDLFRTVNQRVLAEIRGPDDTPMRGLRRYHADHGSFPWGDADNDGHADIGTTSGALPHNDLSLPPTAIAWLNANGWLPLIAYQHLAANSARIMIGASQMNVIPCPGSPCP